MADFNDFGLISQDFERPFRGNQLVLALQFTFKGPYFHGLAPRGAYRFSEFLVGRLSKLKKI